MQALPQRLPFTHFGPPAVAAMGAAAATGHLMNLPVLGSLHAAALAPLAPSARMMASVRMRFMLVPPIGGYRLRSDCSIGNAPQFAHPALETLGRRQLAQGGLGSRA